MARVEREEGRLIMGEQQDLLSYRPPEKTDAAPEPAPKKIRRCRGCNRPGHYAPTCPVANPVAARAREDRRRAERKGRRS